MPRTLNVLASNPLSVSNKAHSAKYTAWSFIPLSVAEVLDPRYKMTNIYFVFAGCLQLIPSITLTAGIPTIWINVGVGMIQDIFMMGMQDFARSRADRATNALPIDICHVQGQGDNPVFETKTWADVKVGDVVRVKDRESFPADCMFLRAPEPEPNQCWVSTKPLDGESDTKLRLASKGIPSLLPDDREETLVRALRGATFRAEAPNDKVNDFTGLLCLPDREPVLVTRQNMLLRGAQLRSTSWVFALVVATGRETKANFGPNTVGRKYPTTLFKLNADLIVLLVVTLVVALIGAAANRRVCMIETWPRVFPS